MKVTTEILLVDHKPGDTDPIADNLKRKYCNLTRVHSVPAGIEAMAVLHRGRIHVNPLPFHLTVLDLNIPLHHTPFVVVSALKTRDDVANSYQSRASSFVIQAERSAPVCVGRNNDRRCWFGRERAT
jgi:hypothetical protein